LVEELRSTDTKITYLFKLKHDIRVESKVNIAKEEIETLLHERVNEVESIAALMKKRPFSSLNGKVIKIMDRMPYLGKLQGFLVIAKPLLLRRILERTTLFKEVFAVFEEKEPKMSEILETLGFGYDGEPTEFKQPTPYAQIFIREIDDSNYVVAVRGIPFQEIFECGLEVLKLPIVTFAKYKDVEKRIAMKENGVKKGIDELFHHLNSVYDRPPRLGLGKDDIGDYVDWAFSRFRKYALHFIHKHRAKADNRMARMVLNLLDVEPGDVILDPYCGSGSFIADASMMGIKAYGLDINPLSTLIARVKCNLDLPIPDLRVELIKLLKDYKGENVTDAALWKLLENIPEGHRQKIRERKTQVSDILAIKNRIDKISGKETLNAFCSERIKNLKDFFYVILSRCIVKLFENNRKNVAEEFKKDALRFYLDLFATKQVSSVLGVPFKPKPEILTMDSRELSLPFKVQGILTSPPYFDAINYLDATSCYSLILLDMLEDGLEELDKNITGTKNVENDITLKKLEGSNLPTSSKRLIELLMNDERTSKSTVIFQYATDMLKVFERLYNLLETNRRMIFVVGKYHHWNLGGDTLRVDGARVIADLARAKGFELEKEIFHTIHKLGGGTRITGESILLFRKPPKDFIVEEKPTEVDEIFKLIKGRVMREIKEYFVRQEEKFLESNQQ